MFLPINRTMVLVHLIDESLCGLPTTFIDWFGFLFNFLFILKRKQNMKKPIPNIFHILHFCCPSFMVINKYNFPNIVSEAKYAQRVNTYLYDIM